MSLVPLVALEAPPDPRGHPLTVELCDSWARLEEQVEDWDGLLAGSASASSFLTREWLGAWWKAFAPSRRLRALLLRAPQGELVGVAALYEDVLLGPLGLRLPRLRLVGDGSHDSDNLDFLIRPGYEAACVRAFLAWLEGQARWQVCELNTLPSDSATSTAFRAALTARGWRHEDKTRPRRIVLLPPTWEAYLAGLSRNERWRMGSHTRKLEAKYAVRVRRCAQEADLPSDLDALFRLHQKRWEERGQSGTFASAARRAFYQDLASRFLARGWLELWLLELEGRPVAAQFGFRYRETLYSLQEGFDPDLAADRVGAVLRAHVLRQLIGEGVRRYDFLAGDDVGKERWGADTWSYVDIHFARPASRGGLFLSLRRHAREAREWLRAHLPSRVFATARRAYRLVEPASRA